MESDGGLGCWGRGFCPGPALGPQASRAEILAGKLLAFEDEAKLMESVGQFMGKGLRCRDCGDVWRP